MSRLISKLVNDAGGWENFLYETLKDVCEKVGQNGFTGDGEEAIESANEILAAYSKQTNIPNLSQSPSIKVQKDTTEVSKVKVEDKTVSESEESEEESEKSPLPPPRAERGILTVDSYAGACQGELTMPDGHLLVHRENIYITTTGGLELGRSTEDGQIRGKGVSGHVNLSGKFRLVFTEADMGTAIMHYQIQQQEA